MNQVNPMIICLTCLMQFMSCDSQLITDPLGEFDFQMDGSNYMLRRIPDNSDKSSLRQFQRKNNSIDSNVEVINSIGYEAFVNDGFKSPDEQYQVSDIQQYPYEISSDSKEVDQYQEKSKDQEIRSIGEQPHHDSKHAQPHFRTQQNFRTKKVPTFVKIIPPYDMKIPVKTEKRYPVTLKIPGDKHFVYPAEKRHPIYVEKRPFPILPVRFTPIKVPEVKPPVFHLVPADQIPPKQYPDKLLINSNKQIPDKSYPDQQQNSPTEVRNEYEVRNQAKFNKYPTETRPYETEPTFGFHLTPLDQVLSHPFEKPIKPTHPPPPLYYERKPIKNTGDKFDFFQSLFGYPKPTSPPAEFKLKKKPLKEIGKFNFDQLFPTQSKNKPDVSNYHDNSNQHTSNQVRYKDTGNPVNHVQPDDDSTKLFQGLTEQHYPTFNHKVPPETQFLTDASNENPTHTESSSGEYQASINSNENPESVINDDNQNGINYHINTNDYGSNSAWKPILQPDDFNHVSGHAAPYDYVFVRDSQGNADDSFMYGTNVNPNLHDNEDNKSFERDNHQSNDDKHNFIYNFNIYPNMIPSFDNQKVNDTENIVKPEFQIFPPDHPKTLEHVHNLTEWHVNSAKHNGTTPGGKKWNYGDSHHASSGKVSSVRGRASSYIEKNFHGTYGSYSSRVVH